MKQWELTRRLALVLLLGTAACQPADSLAVAREQGGARSVAPRADLAAEAGPRTRSSETGAPAPRTVCERFARRVADYAAKHPDDSAAFLGALRDEFVGGTDDPFELKEGLEQRRWNQAYFYAGDGGFRDEIDDAERYPKGGNHQPGHFVSVLLIAARFGEENARLAIAYAGDYGAGDEDDLRLSQHAIELGAGLKGGTVQVAAVAQRVAGFCR